MGSDTGVTPLHLGQQAADRRLMQKYHVSEPVEPSHLTKHLVVQDPATTEWCRSEPKTEGGCPGHCVWSALIDLGSL